MSTPSKAAARAAECACCGKLAPMTGMTDYCEHCWQAVVTPAYEHVESLTPDDPARIMWHGWAVREAYIAGAKAIIDREFASEEAVEIIRDLHSALVRYEADVDAEAPSSHRRMMNRAKAFLADSGRGRGEPIRPAGSDAAGGSNE